MSSSLALFRFQREAEVHWKDPLDLPSTSPEMSWTKCD